MVILLICLLLCPILYRYLIVLIVTLGHFMIFLLVSMISQLPIGVGIRNCGLTKNFLGKPFPLLGQKVVHPLLLLLLVSQREELTSPIQ